MCAREDKRSRWTLLILVICFVISLICVSLMIWKYTTLRDAEVSGDANIACVKCDSLSKGFPAEKVNTILKTLKTRVGKNESCCAQTPAQFSFLMEHVLNQPAEMPERLQLGNPDTYSLVQASAHMGIKADEFYHGKSDSTPDFEKEMRKYELHQDKDKVRNVEWDKTGYTISHSGLYYVYLNVHFVPHSDRKCKEFDQQTWYAHVVLTPDEKTQESKVLLVAEHTCSSPDTIRESETVFVGGNFHLQGKDHLSVEVSGWGLVESSEASNSFGLMMLSP